MASPARWAALLSFALLQSVGFIVAWLLQRVPRAPLPHEDVAALANVSGAHVEIQWPRPRIRVSSLSKSGDGDARLRDFVQHLATALADDAKEVSARSEPPSSLSALQACTADSITTEDCLESLGDPPVYVKEQAQMTNTFDVLLVPTSEGKSALLLGTGLEAVLRWHSSDQAADLAAQAAKRLRQTWLQRMSYDNKTSLFEVAPAYVFSFLLVGDCNQRIAWDFPKDVLAPFMQRFFNNLRLLFDFELESQVVQCGSLGGSGSVVSAATLQEDFLRRTGDWPGDSVTRPARWLPPLVRYVAFKPSDPVRVLDTERKPQRSFAVQGWGTVSLVGASAGGDGDTVACKATCRGREGGAEFLSQCEAAQAASAWVSTLRSWLRLPPDMPVPAEAGNTIEEDSQSEGLALHAALPAHSGIAAWEMLLVARAVHRLFLRRTTETLENLLALIESLPDVVVRPEIGDMVYESASEAQRAVAAAQGEDFTTALIAARRALALALTASLDDTVVAEMYFSWEFKYAVYLPLALPILLPTVVGLIRQTRKARAVRKKLKEL